MTQEQKQKSMIKKFRKEPIVIEAAQWFKNGDHPNDDCEIFIDDETKLPFLGEGKIVRYFRHPDISGELICVSSMSCGHAMHLHGWIDTPEGGHNVCPGDWIITGIAGENYPCKPVIFAKTYKEVELT